ncbi:MAG: hypothetical protein AB7R89_23655 [Dehalococcoidia bacterium]
MKRVGVREFRDHATRYLAGGEVLAIERYGSPIGFYIPAGAGRQERRAEALERLERTIERVLSQTGLTEEELSRLFDLSKPIPEPPCRHEERDGADHHATGG